MGIGVTVAAASVEVPPTCAGCGGEADTRTLAWNRRLKSRYGILSIPCCERCRRSSTIWATWGAPAAVIGGVIGVGVLSYFWTASNPLVVGTLFGAALAVALALVARRARRRMIWPLVEVRWTRSDGTLDLYCVNPEWGEALADRSSGHCYPATRKRRWLPTVLVGGSVLLGAPFSAVIGWMGAHEPVYVDHHGPEPVQIWVDGERDWVLEGSYGSEIWIDLWLTADTHEIGYSTLDAEGPESTVQVAVTGSGTPLYNPAGTACYFVQTHVYSKKSGSRSAGGWELLVPGEVSYISNVEFWFSPPTVDVYFDEGQDIARLNQVDRDPECMRLLSQRCSDEVLHDYVRCRNENHGSDEFSECYDGAVAKCDGQEGS